MSDSNSSASSSGIGGVGVLGIVFVTLKLCGVINWSWWWVTSPFWIPFAVATVIVVIALLCAVATVQFKLRR